MLKASGESVLHFVDASYGARLEAVPPRVMQLVEEARNANGFIELECPLARRRDRRLVIVGGLGSMRAVVRLEEQQAGCCGVRTGDVITISGTVTHSLHGDYDFHLWQPGAEGALALQYSHPRGAKPFLVRN